MNQLEAVESSVLGKTGSGALSDRIATVEKALQLD